MALFKYVAYDGNGKKVESTLEAESQALALSQLKDEQGLMVSTLTQVSQASSSFSSLFNRKQTNARDLEFLTSEILLLLQSGVKFDKAVELLARAKASTPIGEVLSQASSKLKAGSTIADTFGSFERLFDKLYVNLLRTGEESGTLVPVFEGLSRDLKYRNDLRQTITQAVFYPFIILLVCIASVVFIFNFIVPKLAVLFDDRADLAFHTQMIMSLSEWMINYQHYLGGAIVAVGVGLYSYRSDPRLLEWFHRNSRRFPVIGNIVELSERIRFCSSMSLLLKAGIAMDQAVKLSAGNAVNSEVRRELTQASDAIRKGTQLSKALSDTSLFNPLFVSLIEIGEESGEVSRVFNDLSDRSRNEFSQWVSRFTTLLEPLLIITMGFIVGFVVVSMMLSVMSVNDTMM